MVDTIFSHLAPISYFLQSSNAPVDTTLHLESRYVHFLRSNPETQACSQLLHVG